MKGRTEKPHTLATVQEGGGGDLCTPLDFVVLKHFEKFSLQKIACGLTTDLLIRHLGNGASMGRNTMLVWEKFQIRGQTIHVN